MIYARAMNWARGGVPMRRAAWVRDRYILAGPLADGLLYDRRPHVPTATYSPSRDDAYTDDWERFDEPSRVDRRPGCIVAVPIDVDFELISPNDAVVRLKTKITEWVIDNKREEVRITFDRGELYSLNGHVRRRVTIPFLFKEILGRPDDYIINIGNRYI